MLFFSAMAGASASPIIGHVGVGLANSSIGLVPLAGSLSVDDCGLVVPT